ncbi:hypothetical protein WMF20_33070 [Sorangium sp. So ce834]|uniref:hypothetical protein n=1 Tax=Sorangium sp. So ce834 TaxID=3133321 RepID=UPI003F61D074
MRSTPRCSSTSRPHYLRGRRVRKRDRELAGVHLDAAAALSAPASCGTPTRSRADDVWELYYGPVLLAQVTLKNKELQLAKAR